ncbi:fructose-6-phosphate aldolase [Propionicimonas sp.]|uniref:fructose-6-phosphate aldolase n=1 Tax=Propionicimonas sp. TaxID=1955623 RepID=UPI0017BF7295|nr:fructose-6-phosphate aldolase [Propionicimonas sp.]MBU3976843.1 fructose-6-phosphate aldolase [Actinomycetota bacterium]MBA3019532.1 fructose-6-phosphate aldolase [Propionicimonas sp.]MBU3986938.1 fructose-6-phosphate aldolase [Actinomycetota bacterium]MBU4006850.1 fructose-6-phosphate aldolase [Actinomycetota bacterium]MBU4065550.1 fructose-6-phosphate aldolase [Actinomycetota bacterium]
MEILFDTASLAVLEEMTPLYPVAGVTTNPTIIKAEGRIELYEHLRQIRRIIGPDRSLHIQVLAQDADGIVADAHRLLEQVDGGVFAKVPTTEQGIRAIRLLKDEGIGVTATAIYSRIQGTLAIEAGADYIAPYFNRMEDRGIDASAMVKSLAKIIDRHGVGCKILAASFKNVAQVSAALEAGAAAVTVPPALLRAALATPDVTEAVNAFTRDWNDTFGTTELP